MIKHIEKAYNKNALISVFNNIRVTSSIIKEQIKKDNFKIFFNKAWSKWYLVKLDNTSKTIETEGMFNVYRDVETWTKWKEEKLDKNLPLIYEEVGLHNSELDLLFFYLNNYM